MKDQAGMRAPARRRFMQQTGALSLLMGGGYALAQTATAEPWQRAAQIAAALKSPCQFRDASYRITDFGAKPCQLQQQKAWVSFEEQALTETPVPQSFDCYAAIRQAIERCHQEGGGRVIIPKGNWYVAGPIVLLSNVNLHLQAGAHVYFSHVPEDYAKYGPHDCGANGKLTISRWQSNDCLNYSPMVYAYQQENIALTADDWSAVLHGQGGVAFNEQGDCWWTWKGKLKTINAVGQNTVPNFQRGKQSENTPNTDTVADLRQLNPQLSAAAAAYIQGEGEKWRADASYLPALSEAGVPLAQRVFGKGHYLRPPMIQFIECKRVLMEGYEVRDTPFWQHHPVACEDVVIRKVHAHSHGPNSDGFDPEACNRVLIEHCTFDSGDDCIAIKAGKNRDTQYGPSRNIVIRHCTMHSGHGAVTLGSEMAGGIEHVYAEDLLFQNQHWATNPLNTAIRLKTNLNRGGFLRHFYVRRISIPNGVQTTPSYYTSLPGSPIISKTVATAAGAVVTFDCDYTPVSDNVRLRPPEVSDIHISEVKVGNVKTGRGEFSCYQAIVILGPVASDYNGPQPAPAVIPVKRVSITDCDFGTPVQSQQALYLFNVAELDLRRVRIAGKAWDGKYSALPEDKRAGRNAAGDK